MSERLTGWYDASIKPARVGVYEVDPFISNPWYRHWDGQYWYWGGRSPEVAMRWAGQLRTRISKEFEDPWRGLAQPPKGES